MVCLRFLHSTFKALICCWDVMHFCDTFSNSYKKTYGSILCSIKRWKRFDPSYHCYRKITLCARWLSAVSWVRASVNMSWECNRYLMVSWAILKTFNISTGIFSGNSSAGLQKATPESVSCRTPHSSDPKLASRASTSTPAKSLIHSLKSFLIKLHLTYQFPI